MSYKRRPIVSEFKMTVAQHSIVNFAQLGLSYSTVHVSLPTVTLNITGAHPYLSSACALYIQYEQYLNADVVE